MMPQRPPRLTAGLACMVATLLLAACASAPTPPAAEPPAPLPAPPVVPTETALQPFEREQTDRAIGAEARGRWAEAAWAWEVLSALRPEDGARRQRAEAARLRAAREAGDRAAAADAAARRGELDAAAQAYLEALALDPELRSAADALRAVERERERRRLAGRNARLGATARRPLEEMPAPAAAGDPEQQRRLNAAREHAALLASQGDLDAAIQLLREAMPTRPDSISRTQLADLYVQKAESVRRRDPAAAKAALDAALALDRRHAGALALQRQLTGNSTTTIPQPAPASRR